MRFHDLFITYTGIHDYCHLFDHLYVIITIHKFNKPIIVMMIMDLLQQLSISTLED